jgi:predicted dithiol-disulfide oxidoreductase (DUF899 family)
MESHRIVSKAEAREARVRLLAEEKAFTKARDALAAQRRMLPWVRVDKPYRFASAAGPVTLADLFRGRRQLIVQHFMFAPGWAEGCVGCSFSADHVDGALPHVQARDASFVAVSRAPIADIERYRKRMGWRFPWVSSEGSDFNYDFDVSFRPEDIAAGRASYNYEPYDGEMEDLSGHSVFIRSDQGEIFHTYSTFARGDEMLMAAYMYIDLLPKGRDEDGLDYPSAWWRHHDKYDAVKPEPCTCHEDRAGGPSAIP